MNPHPAGSLVNLQSPNLNHLILRTSAAIEDETSIAELERDYLELSDFEVELEEDGSKGLERALIPCPKSWKTVLLWYTHGWDFGQETPKDQILWL